MLSVCTPFPQVLNLNVNVVQKTVKLHSSVFHHCFPCTWLQVCWSAASRNKLPSMNYIRREQDLISVYRGNTNHRGVLVLLLLR